MGRKRFFALLSLLLSSVSLYTGLVSSVTILLLIGLIGIFISAYLLYRIFVVDPNKMPKDLGRNFLSSTEGWKD